VATISSSRTEAVDPPPARIDTLPPPAARSGMKTIIGDGAVGPPAVDEEPSQPQRASAAKSHGTRFRCFTVIAD
jgi:hypothetical protein